MLFLFLFFFCPGIFAADYYWVGGSGNWSDISHWATASGGGIMFFTPPTAADNVHFDASSFIAVGQTVTINTTAVCNDMNWTGAAFNPAFTCASTYSLRIYGSITFIPVMTVSINGSVYFEATTTGKTITSAGKSFSGNVYFQGIGGGWTLQDEMKVNSIISFINGTLNTNSKTLTCIKFNSDFTNTRSLSINNSTINCSEWKLYGSNLTFSAGGSTINASSFTHTGTAKIYHNTVASAMDGGGSDFNLIIDNGGLTATGISHADSIISLSFLDMDAAYVNYIRATGDAIIRNGINFKKVILDAAAAITSISRVDYLSVGSDVGISIGIVAGTAVFNGNGIINGNNTFDTFTLAAGKIYVLGKNQTQTINKKLNINGKCSGYLTIQSSLAGTTASITKASGNITGNYLMLRDIQASGGAIFTANNSIDLGNNPGWIINSPTTTDLYWVGGTGNWSDTSHWSTSSGGPGGACLPNPNVNVHFDANSFNTSGRIVTMDAKVATCRDIIWTGAKNKPAFVSSPGFTLHIYGSLTFISSMVLNFSGDIYLESPVTGRTITTANISIGGNMFFESSTGGWTLLDSLKVKGNINFNKGNLNTNRMIVICSIFNAKDSITRNLNISGSTIITHKWDVNGMNLTLNASNSLIKDIADFIHFNTTKVYHNISSSNALVTIKGGGSKFNLITISDGTLYLNDDNTIDSLLVLGILYLSDNDSINYLYVKNFGLIGNYNTPYTQLINKAVFDSIGYVYGNNRIKYLRIDKFGLIGGSSIIGTAMLYGNADINGNNTFDTLGLFAGNTYTLEYNKIQTINGRLFLDGRCSAYITLESSDVGSQAEISKSSGAVTGNYLIIRDVKASGGAIFTANNSIGVGTNTGWIINAISALDLYWIGGTGNWSDSSHWAMVSGGTGGACIPGPYDNVFFDSKSFSASGQTVKMDINNANCNNMVWTGALYKPTFELSSGKTLHFFGSITLIKDMFFKFDGFAYFESKTTGKTITSAGHKFGADVHFTGTGGEWILQDSLTVGSSIYFLEGKLNTNSKKLSCSGFNSFVSKTRTLDISNSVLSVKTWGVIGMNLTLIATNSHIKNLSSFTHFYVPGIYHNITSNSSLFTLKGGDSKFNVVNVLKGSIQLENNNVIDSLIVADAANFLNSNTINYVHIKGAVLMGSAAAPDRQHITKAVLDSSAIIYGDNVIGYLSIGKIAYIQGNDTMGNVFLFGDAIIDGNIRYDSLTFSAGKTYQLQDGKTQTIKYQLYISGNNCFPTSIRSRNVGNVTTIFKSSGKVSADFIELRDIKATGGASFFAGSHSSNLGNNPGWNFSTSPDYIYGLGKDTVLCYGDLLRTSNFNGAQTFTWQDNSTKPYYKVTKPGAYWVKAEFGKGCTYADTILVTKVKPRPDGGFIVNDSMQCITANKFIFTDTSSIDSGYIAHHTWLFGDGITDTTYNPIHVYSKSDTFFLKLINESSLGCLDTAGQLLYVYDPPKAGFIVNDSQQCFAGNNFIFTNTTPVPQGAGKYLWDFGDGSKDTLISTSHTYLSPDTFRVVLYALSGYGCDDTFSTMVYVYAGGAASFSVNDSMQCLPGNEFIFKDNAADDTLWTWDLGDGTILYSDSFAYTYTTADTFLIKLTVTSAIGCKDSVIRTVIVQPSPTAGFSITDSIQCLKGNNFGFVPAIINNNIQFIYWDFGDTTSSITDTAYHNYQYSGSYAVKSVFVSALGCTDSVLKKVYVQPSPHASFVIYDSAQCFERNDFGFINKSTISAGSLSHLWDFGDNSSSILLDPHHQYLYADTFSVKLKVTSQDGCTDTFIKNTYLHVHPEPQAAFLINDSIQCLKGNSFNYTNTTTLKSGTFKQLWDFSDGTTSDSLNTTHSYSASDTFTTKLLIISDWACKDSVMQKIYVHPMPKAGFSINANPQALAGNNFVFTNLSNITYGTLNHQWDFGDGATSALLNGSHSYATADTFNVKLRSVSDAGCPDSITQQVYVTMTVTVDFQARNFCLGDTVVFESFGNAAPDSFRNYIWDYGDGNNAIVWKDPVHYYDDTGTYSVTMIGLTYLGYKDSITKTITILPKPDVSITYYADTVFYSGGSSTLTANGTFDSILWSSGATTASIVVKQAGIYSVRVVGNNGCDATDQIRIYVLEMKPFEAMTIITPNNDGMNDVWKIFNIGQYQPCKLNIYNRWGNELYSTNNYQNNWDGIYQGKSLPEGTYYYFLETRDGSVYKGAINIVR